MPASSDQRSPAGSSTSPDAVPWRHPNAVPIGSRPAPHYEITRARVETVLSRLRRMYSSISGDSPYNQGLREGVRSASMAMKEDLDTNVTQTLSGAPVRMSRPPLEELLVWADSEKLEKLAEEMAYYNIELHQLPEILECEHEYQLEGTGPDGGDLLSDCTQCGVDQEFLVSMGWYVGEIACSFCGPHDVICGECGKGLG